MICADCFKDVRSRNDLLRQACEDALRYAKDHQQTMIVYEESPNTFKYMAYEPKSTGPKVIALRIVSHL